MSFTIRPAKLSDLEQIVALMIADAEERTISDPGLWRLDSVARDKTLQTIKAAMEAEAPPVRQQWLVAEQGDDLVGVTHTILLPVPPIYAGEMGPPGLVMEDCFVAPHAPPETRDALLTAAESDLVDAGALVLLASSVAGGAWEEEYARHGYEPLTMYFAKTGLSKASKSTHVQPASDSDVPDIVASSAVNRQILDQLHRRFWKPHAEADARFGAWMTRSLTLEDRDMFVSSDGDKVCGYAISQPATALHFPAPHDITGIGVIDDFYHDALEEPQSTDVRCAQALALFEAAEAARGRRGDHSVLVVCPVAWRSKIALLEQAGYRNAMTWHVKFVT
ncbi:hypothetical protein [Roseobacter sp. A03A-229]